MNDSAQIILVEAALQLKHMCIPLGFTSSLSQFYYVEHSLLPLTIVIMGLLSQVRKTLPFKNIYNGTAISC